MNALKLGEQHMTPNEQLLRLGVRNPQVSFAIAFISDLLFAHTQTSHWDTARTSIPATLNQRTRNHHLYLHFRAQRMRMVWFRPIRVVPFRYLLDLGQVEEARRRHHVDICITRLTGMVMMWSGIRREKRNRIKSCIG